MNYSIILSDAIVERGWSSRAMIHLFVKETDTTLRAGRAQCLRSHSGGLSWREQRVEHQAMAIHRITEPAVRQTQTVPRMKKAC